MFAVHRGKITEGKNFIDNQCNGIILIGIPNLNISDPKIQLKELYYKNITKKTTDPDDYHKYYSRQRD